jgi:RND family efflux transporter MFP subunit
MKIRKYIIVVFLIAISAGCTKRTETDSVKLALVDVKTTLVRSGQIDETITVSGSTKFKREAQLRSPITGIITDFKFFNGDKLAKNNMIASVLTKESQSAIVGAEELVHSAKTVIELEEAKKALELAKITGSIINLYTPFDGILNKKLKNELEVVSEGEEVATIVDPSSLIFVIDIPTMYINKVKIGQQVSIRFNSKPGKTYTGIINRIEPQVNTGDQTVPSQVNFTSSNSELAGALFGEAIITVGRHSNILLVPKTALLKNDEDNSTSVVLVGSDSIAHKIDVQVGLKSDSTIEVLSPAILAGSIVIIEGHYGLPDSTKVRIQN